MIWLALAATWWVGIGLIVGANRARINPGPTDGLRWAAAWALGWPVLWISEKSYGQ